MHPLEHIIYFSTVVVQQLLALHPLNALQQIQLATFQPAPEHSNSSFRSSYHQTLGFDSRHCTVGCETIRSWRKSALRTNRNRIIENLP